MSQANTRLIISGAEPAVNGKEKRRRKKKKKRRSRSKSAKKKKKKKKEENRNDGIGNNNKSILQNNIDEINGIPPDRYILKVKIYRI